MSFFLICFGMIALISSRCYVIDRLRPQRRTTPTPLVDRMQQYREMEAVAIRLIMVNATSRRETRERIDQFYRNYPPPNPQERLRRVFMRPEYPLAQTSS